MTDILVHRCELRIRRTSGWAWGASPDDLIKAATRAIPQLLAARLTEIAVPDGETITIDRPVTVTIQATARQLAALGDGTPGTPELAELRARISANVSAAVVEAIAREGVSVATAKVIGQVAVEEHARDVVTEAELASVEAPRRAVRAWWRSGAIDAVLARLEPRALDLLHELLLGQVAAAAEAPPEAVVEVIERLAQRVPTQEAPAARLRRRIALAAGALEVVPRASAAQLHAAIDRIAPLPEPHGEPELAAPREAAAARAIAAPAVAELEISSALPFLLLSSLRHAGWLDAAAALLDVHDCEDSAFALAAGLAAKVLDPLERGWARSPGGRLALAVFAGRTEPIADAEIAAAAAKLRPMLAPLDAGLRAVLARARRPLPLVLWRDDCGWLLVDTDGTTVLAAGALRDVLAAASAAPIFVPARFADADVFDQVDYANARFVTDAPPGRSDAWRSFAAARGRLYTNDTATPAGKLAAVAAHLETALALVEELAGALAERPAIPREAPIAFEASCALAATAALADVAARLFPAEPTTPVLALTRFRNLDARVWFEPDRIRVRVPLGRRHADLLRHAVLGDFANVPWLGGRVLDLGGG